MTTRAVRLAALLLSIGPVGPAMAVVAPTYQHGGQAYPAQGFFCLNLAGDYTGCAPPTPSVLVSGQVRIAATGTAVRLPAAALVNGVVVKAKSTNASQTSTYSGMLGGSAVTTTYDGTGAGYPLAPGEAASVAVSNLSVVYVNGTAGDVFSYEGN